MFWNLKLKNAMTKPMMMLFYVMSPLVKRKQDTYSHYIIFASPDGLSQGAGKFPFARDYCWICDFFVFQIFNTVEKSKNSLWIFPSLVRFINKFVATYILSFFSTTYNFFRPPKKVKNLSYQEI